MTNKLTGILIPLMLLVIVGLTIELKVEQQINTQELDQATQELRQAYRDVHEYVELLDVIYNVAEQYNLEPELALAMMRVESNFDTNAINGDSHGLMQVSSLYYTGDLFDLKRNVECSFSLLSSLKEESNNLDEVLGKYNRGRRGYEEYVARTGQASSSYSYKVSYLLNQLKHI